MATFWQILSTENRNKLARFYEKNFGKKLIPPARDKRAIHCEAKLESPTELVKVMEQAPNYPIEVQGRE